MRSTILLTFLLPRPLSLTQLTLTQRAKRNLARLTIVGPSATALPPQLPPPASIWMSARLLLMLLAPVRATKFMTTSGLVEGPVGVPPSGGNTLLCSTMT
jgi:hypothetical protein